MAARDAQGFSCRAKSPVQAERSSIQPCSCLPPAVPGTVPGAGPALPGWLRSPRGAGQGPRQGGAMGTRLRPGALARSWSLFPRLAFQQLCLSRLLTFSLILLHEGGQRAARLPRLLITLPLCPPQGRAAPTERCSVTSRQTWGAKDGHGGADGAWAGQRQPRLALPAALGTTSPCRDPSVPAAALGPSPPLPGDTEVPKRREELPLPEQEEAEGRPGTQSRGPHAPRAPSPAAPEKQHPARRPPAHTMTPLGSAGHRCHRGSPDPPGRRRCPSCCCLPRCSSRRLCRLIKQILHLLGGSRARQGSSRGGTEQGEGG